MCYGHKTFSYSKVPGRHFQPAGLRPSPPPGNCWVPGDVFLLLIYTESVYMHVNIQNGRCVCGVPKCLRWVTLWAVPPGFCSRSYMWYGPARDSLEGLPASNYSKGCKDRWLLTQSAQCHSLRRC